MFWLLSFLRLFVISIIIVTSIINLCDSATLQSNRSRIRAAAAHEARAVFCRLYSRSLSGLIQMEMNTIPITRKWQTVLSWNYLHCQEHFGINIQTLVSGCPLSLFLNLSLCASAEIDHAVSCKKRESVFLSLLVQNSPLLLLFFFFIIFGDRPPPPPPLFADSELGMVEDENSLSSLLSFFLKRETKKWKK
jgi:hypothetical protein